MSNTSPRPRGAGSRSRLERAEVGEEHHAVDERCTHLADPAAEENRERRVGDEMQRGEEADLVEGEDGGDRERDAGKSAVAEPRPAFRKAG